MSFHFLSSFFPASASSSGEPSSNLVRMRNSMMGQSAPSLSPTMVSLMKNKKWEWKSVQQQEEQQRARIALKRPISLLPPCNSKCVFIFDGKWRHLFMFAFNYLGSSIPLCNACQCKWQTLYLWWVLLAAAANLQCVLSVHRVSTFIITLCTNTSPYRVYTTADLWWWLFALQY